MKEVIKIEDFDKTRDFPVGTHFVFFGDKFVIMEAGNSASCNECSFRTQFGGWCSSYIKCLHFNRCDNKNVYLKKLKENT